MNCATHPSEAAVAYCRTCGKPLCAKCIRDVRGVIYCEACLAARLEGTAPPPAFVPPQQTPYQQVVDQGLGMKVPPGSSSGPNPAVAGILAGFFPFGVGPVYCSQYAKGLAHLVIFALLIVCANHAGDWGWIFGLGIAFFYVYQIIDSVRTAHAIQEGQPVPDPMGLAQTFSVGRFEPNKVPVGAVVLIGLGVLFLLHNMGFWEYGFERYWPLLLVFLGGWMFYRQWERSKLTCMCGRCRTRSIMGPAMVLTTGIVLLLASTDVAGIDRTWPAWLLVVGVVKLLQSTASSQGHVGPLPPGPATPDAPPPPSPPAQNEPSSEGVNRV
jgi:LiaI-LiaF-like transmembrane region/B-box zinc finger